MIDVSLLIAREKQVKFTRVPMVSISSQDKVFEAFNALG